MPRPLAKQWRRRESNPRPQSRMRWRLRAYPALCSRPGVASPAGFSGTSLLEDVPGLAEADRPGLSRHLMQAIPAAGGRGPTAHGLASG
jgi:hypothetical protein